ncbi:MAG TPA: DUF3516 domain-containing protein, partial [Anaeromyxobacteraceae bacterium]|nr:DUF3516 domain-containing protein [Anaeromyxobacteraceae bacterium]
YVREYELQRSEGLLLRYLSESYKTLAQTVPEGYRDDAVDDVLAFLRATVRGVDSSLIDEWERLRDADYQPLPEAGPARPLAPPPLWANERAFKARIRAELHRLLVALARRDWAAAGAALRDPAGAWTPAALEAAIAPYFAEHPRIDVTPAARRPDQTLIAAAGERRWTATQRIVDEEGEADWALFCEVDLSGPVDPDLPLLGLLRVGV